MFTQAIIQSVGALKKRPKPHSINHDSVGTDETLKQRHDRAQRLLGLRLSHEHLRPYVMSLDEMKKWGYITEVPEGPGGTEPNQLGKTKQCERCNQHYSVKSAQEAPRTECKFHWGRPYTNRINGTLLARLARTSLMLCSRRKSAPLQVLFTRSFRKRWLRQRPARLFRVRARGTTYSARF